MANWSPVANLIKRLLAQRNFVSDFYTYQHGQVKKKKKKKSWHSLRMLESHLLLIELGRDPRQSQEPMEAMTMERTRAAYYTALAKLQANSFQSGWPSTKDMAALVLTIAGTIGSAWVAPPGELGILDLARENVENPPPPRRIRREVTDGGTAT